MQEITAIMKILKSICLSAILLLQLKSEAQTDTVSSPTPHSWYTNLAIGLDCGISVPLKLLGKDASTPNSVRRIRWDALSGFSLAVHADYRIMKLLGIRIAAGENNNANNDQGETRDIISPPVSVTSQGAYRNWQFMAGPCTSFRLTEKMDFTAQLLVGLLASSAPRIDEIIYGPFVSSLSLKYRTGTGFACLLGVGARYKLNKQISVSLNASYLGADITYPSYGLVTNPTGAMASGSYSSQTIYSPTNMSIEMIQLSTGITYHF